MGLEDWRINLESVAVLQPIADWTQHMQGTKYPTLPLVLPTIYGLIEGMSPEAPLILSFQCQKAYELMPREMHSGVLTARSSMYDDWVSRWITNLPLEVKRTYAIATLLHPCFKKYEFIDNLSFIPITDKAWALRELRTEWMTVWKTPSVVATPTAAVATAEATPEARATGKDDTTADTGPIADMGSACPATNDVNAQTASATKHRKVSLGALLGARIKKEAPTRVPCLSTMPDELEQYLLDLEEPDIDVNVLAWWKVKESKWPALTKMVKQYFSAPASSAGVERVFSAAGKMHGDLQKSVKDTTLEHSLFAAFNTD